MFSRSTSVPSTLLAADVELGGAGDGHDGGLDRVGDDEIGGVGDAAGHVQGDDDDALLPDLTHRVGDLATHERAGHDQNSGARQAADGAHGGGQIRLSDEGNRVDGD